MVTTFQFCPAGLDKAKKRGHFHLLVRDISLIAAVMRLPATAMKSKA